MIKVSFTYPPGGEPSPQSRWLPAFYKALGYEVEFVEMSITINGKEVTAIWIDGFAEDDE